MTGLSVAIGCAIIIAFSTPNTYTWAQEEAAPKKVISKKPDQKPISKDTTLKEKNSKKKSKPLAKPKSSLKFPVVKWYRPKIDSSPKKKRIRVSLSGKTQPGSRVYVSRKVILVVDSKKKVWKFKRSALLAQESNYVIANSKGYFVIPMDLPAATINIPFKIIPPEGRKYESNLLINMRVEKLKVELANQGVLTLSPILRPRNRLWAGVGYNYLRYSQSSSEGEFDLQYEIFKGPSYFLKANRWINETWDVGMTYKVSPGFAQSSADIQVANGDYTWTILAAEGTNYPEEWLFKLWKKYDSQLGYRFGIQHHIVPFITRTGNSETEFEITTNSLTMATAGFQLVVYPKQKWSFEWFMRYQIPVTSGSVFEISPQFAFDGSVGVMYDFKPNFATGVFWYGQWHQYNFTHYDRYLDSEINGDQTLFFSNIDLRLSYQF